MKAASANTIALLASNQFIMADLLTITLVNGTVLRYTDGDGDLVYGGNTFSSSSPFFQCGEVSTNVTLEVASLSMTLYPATTDTISGIPFGQFASNGGFDSAEVRIDRCFMATYGDTSAGIINRFFGNVSEVTPSRSSIELTVKSPVELLNIQMPRNLYQAGCLNTLFDAGCNLSKAAWEASGNTTAGSNQVVLNCNLAQANGYFNQGVIAFNTGANAGVKRTVKSYTTGSLVPVIPFPFTPVAGDLFVAYPGCDKKQNTCGTTSATVTAAANGPLTLVAADYKKISAFAANTAVKVTSTGNVPAPLVSGTTYYTRDVVVNSSNATTEYDAEGNPYEVVNSIPASFKVAATAGGNAIVLTNAGTGTITAKPVDKFNNLTHFRAYPYIPVPETSI